MRAPPRRERSPRGGGAGVGRGARRPALAHAARRDVRDRDRARRRSGNGDRQDGHGRVRVGQPAADARVVHRRAPRPRGRRARRARALRRVGRRADREGLLHPARQPVGRMVAVCLAVHRPDPQLLRRQLASLEAQTYGDWVLVREDDPAGTGAYRAFERCLRRAPADARLVAPCDQDDVWHPDKLAVLAAALEDSGALLAYCDVWVVSPDGAVLSETYWTDRVNGWRNMDDLLATNVVTGAASLLRREVLDVALPFPPEVDGSYHDHWLALCALALGDLAYVDRPLVDYVQHGANLVGHAPRRAPVGVRSSDPWRVRAARDRERHVVRPQVMARALLQRAGDRMAPAKRRAVQRAARGDGTWADVGRLVWLALDEQARPRRTLDARRRAARGAVWARVARVARSPRS